MVNKIKRYALISVFDKKDVADFARTLLSLNYGIIASEGTGKELTKNKIPFVAVQKVTKNPIALKDCIKTISFYIQSGIVYNRSNYKHIKDIKKLKIKPIDIVICNFPPFDRAIKNPNFNFDIYNIDVGGPTMARTAATNFKYVLVVVDPNDYKKVAKAMSENKITNKLKQHLAAKAFAYISSYDSKIAKYLS